MPISDACCALFLKIYWLQLILKKASLTICLWLEVETGCHFLFCWILRFRHLLALRLASKAVLATVSNSTIIADTFKRKANKNTQSR